LIKTGALAEARFSTLILRFSTSGRWLFRVFSSRSDVFMTAKGFFLNRIGLALRVVISVVDKRF
jgi:hypothetical protein